MNNQAVAIHVPNGVGAPPSNVMQHQKKQPLSSCGSGADTKCPQT